MLICLRQDVGEAAQRSNRHLRVGLTPFLFLEPHLVDLVAGLDEVISKLPQPVKNIFMHGGNSSRELTHMNLRFQSLSSFFSLPQFPLRTFL